MSAKQSSFKQTLYSPLTKPLSKPPIKSCLGTSLQSFTFIALCFTIAIHVTATSTLVMVRLYYGFLFVDTLTCYRNGSHLNEDGYFLLHSCCLLNSCIGELIQSTNFDQKALYAVCSVRTFRVFMFKHLHQFYQERECILGNPFLWSSYI